MSDNKAGAAPSLDSMSEQSIEQIKSLEDIFVHPLKGKVAVVTGGSRGLGFNIVNRLCEAGAKVVIADVKESDAVDVLAKRGYETAFVQSDVTKISDCYHVIDFAAETFGSVDILISNAARWMNYSYLDVPEEAYDCVLDIGLKGSYFMGQAAARYMVRNKVQGHIIFISSSARHGAGRLNSFYQTAKEGVAAMTRAVAGELIQYGIRVNCVAPGAMLSPGVITNSGSAGKLYGEEFIAESKATNADVPMAKNPDMVALVVYALCTPMADFIAGETIDVDGGAFLNVQKKPYSFTIEGCVPGPQA